MNEKELCKAAIDAMKNAYVPYSGYRVGAALMTEDGKLFTGCNIENAAYTPTVCAERTAVFKAVSEGEREFLKLAVVGGKGGKTGVIAQPCGVCRQVLREFCQDDFEIIFVKDEDNFEKHTLSQILPFSFRPENLL